MSPAEALAAAAAYERLIIVDFDETLFLRNSTEMFIDCASPALPAAIILKLLDLAAPWRLRGGDSARDAWRVRAVQGLAPWTMARWRRHCAQHGASLVNQPLLRALAEKKFIIASNGFTDLISPLLAPMGCADVPLIACRNAADRVGGKRALITAAIGADALAGAMVITDSEADREVLDACALPCLVKWKDAKFERALRRVYLPGDYLVQVKRPTQRHALRHLLMTDLLLWLLIAGRPDIFNLAGLSLLFASFWSVYETGYYDNDRCAQRFESDPVLSDAFFTFDATNFAAKAWASAVAFGLAGCAAIAPHGFFSTALGWFALLAALALVFYGYNRIDKTTRIWLYLPLQCFRSLALAAVIPLGPVALAATASQIVSRWQEYFSYRLLRRHGVAQWPDIPARLIQFMLFALGLFVIALSPERGTLISWRVPALFAWSLVLARKQLAMMI